MNTETSLSQGLIQRIVTEIRTAPGPAFDTGTQQASRQGPCLPGVYTLAGETVNTHINSHLRES